MPSVTRALRLLVSACCCISLCLCVGTGIASAKPKTGTGAGVVLSVAPIPSVAKPSPGTSQVTWSTGNGSPRGMSRLLPTVGRKHCFRIRGPKGPFQTPWLSAGNAYVLRLYSIAPRRRLLARLRIDKTATLTVVGRTARPDDDLTRRRPCPAASFHLGGLPSPPYSLRFMSSRSVVIARRIGIVAAALVCAAVLVTVERCAGASAGAAAEPRFGRIRKLCPLAC